MKLKRVWTCNILENQLYQNKEFPLDILLTTDEVVAIMVKGEKGTCPDDWMAGRKGPEYCFTL